MLGTLYTGSFLKQVIRDAHVLFWCTQIDCHFMQMLL